MGEGQAARRCPKGALCVKRPWRILKEVSRCFSTKLIRTFEALGAKPPDELVPTLSWCLLNSLGLFCRD